MNKKGILDTVMSWLLFAFYVLTIIMVMSICGCATTCKKDVASGINTDSGGIADLRASEQLSAYLRTGMPDAAMLNSMVDALDGKEGMSINVGLGNAKAFLEKHPEVYVGKDYAGFLVSLYPYSEDDDARNAFDAVTRAMFSMPLYSKKVREMNSGRLDKLFFTPTVDLNLGSRKMSVYDTGDWHSPNFARSISFEKAYAVKALPTADGKGIEVRLTLFVGEESLEEASQPVP
jgi:hypothetical protein